MKSTRQVTSLSFQCLQPWGRRFDCSEIAHVISGRRPSTHIHVRGIRDSSWGASPICLTAAIRGSVLVGQLPLLAVVAVHHRALLRSPLPQNRSHVLVGTPRLPLLVAKPALKLLHVGLLRSQRPCWWHDWGGIQRKHSGARGRSFPSPSLGGPPPIFLRCLSWGQLLRLKLTRKHLLLVGLQANGIPSTFPLSVLELKLVLVLVLNLNLILFSTTTSSSNSKRLLLLFLFLLLLLFKSPSLG